MSKRSEWQRANPHGTRRRYGGTTKIPGCRCKRCAAANREYMRLRRGTPLDQPVRKARPAPGPTGECAGDIENCEFASRSHYVRGCREEPCRSENRLYQQDYMAWFRHGVRKGEWRSALPD